MMKHTQKLLTLILVAVIISTMFSPVLVKAQTVSLNTSSETSYGYTKADDQNIKASEINTKVVEFIEPINSFTLEGDIVDTNIIVNFENETSTELLKVFMADGGRDDKPEIINLSQLFTFENKLKSVEIFSQNSVENIRLNTLDNKTHSNGIDKSALEPSEAIKKDLFTKMGINIVTRQEWGGPATSNWDPYITVPNTIVIHHTATGVDNNDPANLVRIIYNEHFYRCADNSGSYNPSNPQPNCDEPAEWWEDIGYNYLIDQFGNIYEGRAGENGVVGAHSPNNSNTIGIAMIGNYQSQNITSQAREALRKLMGSLGKLNNINLLQSGSVVGHRDRNPTACPGTVLYNDLSNIKNEANQYSQSSTSNELNTAVTKANTYFNSTVNLQEVSDDRYKVMLDMNSVTTQQKEDSKNGMVTSQNFKELKNFLFFDIDKNYLRKELTEQYLQMPNVNVQPSLIYDKTTWDNSSATRSIPSDYNPSIQWNLEQIKQPEAWKELGGCASDNLCGGDPSVTLAVIDTGVAYEDFNFDAGQTYSLEEIEGFNIDIPGSSTANGIYNEGYDRQYVTSPELSNTNFTANGYDVPQDFFCILRQGTGDDCNATELDKVNHANDDDGHGTFVTTIIAANTGDNSGSNIAGIAHNVTIMPIKVFFPNDSSMCYTSTGDNDPSCLSGNSQYSLRGFSTSNLIVWGIDYAVANGADVINMSLSGGGTDSAIQTAINNAVAAGVSVVVAAGNNSADTANYFPSGLNNVINVGAVNSDGTKASYSNFGNKIDVVAPVGNGIPSQWFSCANDDTCFLENAGNKLTTFTSSTSPVSVPGTSFAAPQVSALVALIKSKHPDLIPSEIENILKSTTTDLGTTGFDSNTGFGRINSVLVLNNLWNNWRENGGTTPHDNIAMVEYDSKLYQSLKGWDGRVFTRSYDGATWTNWQYNGGSTPGEITIEVYDSKLYQAVRGWDGRVFTRSFDGVTWTSWVYTEGSTNGIISMEVYDSKLYQAITSKDGKLLTRSFDGISWTSFQDNGGISNYDSTLQTFDDRLYQTMRENDGRIFTRTYNGSVWSSWSYNGGSSPKDVEMAVFNLKMYQAVPGWDGRIFLRSYDGVTWTNWQYINERTTKNVKLAVSNSELFISIINANNQILTSRLSTSSQLGSWLNMGGETYGKINMVEFQNDIYQSVVGRSTKIYTRNLRD